MVGDSRCHQRRRDTWQVYYQGGKTGTHWRPSSPCRSKEGTKYSFTVTTISPCYWETQNSLKTWNFVYFAISKAINQKLSELFLKFTSKQFFPREESFHGNCQTLKIAFFLLKILGVLEIVILGKIKPLLIWIRLRSFDISKFKMAEPIQSIVIVSQFRLN